MLSELTDDELFELVRRHSAHMRLLADALARGNVVAGYLGAELDRRLAAKRAVPGAVAEALGRISAEAGGPGPGPGSPSGSAGRV